MLFSLLGRGLSSYERAHADEKATGIMIHDWNLSRIARLLSARYLILSKFGLLLTVEELIIRSCCLPSLSGDEIFEGRGYKMLVMVFAQDVACDF
jgi:hypothetical protein